MLLKKDLYNAKIKNIEGKIPGITNWATSTTLNAKINEFKNVIPGSIHLATSATLNANIKEVKGKIPIITNLATTATLTAVENEIPNVRDSVKKADYDAEIKDIKNKYFTTSDCNKFFLTPMWLSYDLLWAIFKGKASLTRS